MADALLTLDAVRESMPDNAALMALGDMPVKAKFDRGELTITVSPGDIVAATSAVQAAGYNFFEDLTAVDWYPSEPRFQISYHIVSMTMKQRVRLAVVLEGDDPSVDSITSIWPSSNFYEREVFDLFGIRFIGHPNLTRIMMPTDWKGHPLRKDYPVEGYR
ncbi:MAG: NADH-quinone oxidoreductase subunit C [Janthinobacterium lividum]